MVDRQPSKSIVNLGSASVDNVSSGWQSTMSSRKVYNIYILFPCICGSTKRNLPELDRKQVLSVLYQFPVFVSIEKQR